MLGGLGLRLSAAISCSRLGFRFGDSLAPEFRQQPAAALAAKEPAPPELIPLRRVYSTSRSSMPSSPIGLCSMTSGT